MAKTMDELLQLVADVQDFFPKEDALTDLIRTHSSDELDLNELDLIAAASAAPRFEELLKKKK